MGTVRLFLASLTLILLGGTAPARIAPPAADPQDEDYALWLDKKASWKTIQDTTAYRYVLRRVLIDTENPTEAKEKNKDSGKDNKDKIKDNDKDKDKDAERDLIQKRNLEKKAKGDWKGDKGKIEGDWETKKSYTLKSVVDPLKSEREARGEKTTVAGDYSFRSTRKKVGGLWEKIFGEKTDTVALQFETTYPSEFVLGDPIEIKAKATLNYDVRKKGIPCLLLWSPPPIGWTPPVTSAYDADAATKSHSVEFMIKLEPQKDDAGNIRYQPDLSEAKWLGIFGGSFDKMPEEYRKAWEDLRKEVAPKKTNVKDWILPTLRCRFACGPWDPKGSNQYEFCGELVYELEVEQKREWKCTPLVLPELKFGNTEGWGDPDAFQAELAVAAKAIPALTEPKSKHDAIRKELKEILDRQPPKQEPSATREEHEKLLRTFQIEIEKAVLENEKKLRLAETDYFKPENFFACYAALRAEDRTAVRNALRVEATCLAHACVEALDETRKISFRFDVPLWETEREASYLRSWELYTAYKDRLGHILGIWSCFDQAEAARLELSFQHELLLQESQDPTFSKEKLAALQMQLRNVSLDDGWIYLVRAQIDEEAAIQASDTYYQAWNEAAKQSDGIPWADHEDWRVKYLERSGQFLIHGYQRTISGLNVVLNVLVDNCKWGVGLVTGKLVGYTPQTLAEKKTEEIANLRKRYVEKHDALQFLKKLGPEQMKKWSETLLGRGAASAVLPMLREDRQYHEATRGGLYRLAACFTSKWDDALEWEYLIAYKHAELALVDMRKALNLRRFGDDLGGAWGSQMAFGVLPVKFPFAEEGGVSYWAYRIINPASTLKVVYENWGDTFVDSELLAGARSEQLAKMKLLLADWRKIHFDDPVKLGIVKDSPDAYARHLELNFKSPYYMEFLDRHVVFQNQRHSIQPILAAVPAFDLTFARKFLGAWQQAAAAAEAAERQKRKLRAMIEDRLKVWDYEDAFELAKQLGGAEEQKLRQEFAWKRSTEVFVDTSVSLLNTAWQMFLIGRIVKVIEGVALALGIAGETAAAVEGSMFSRLVSESLGLAHPFLPGLAKFLSVRSLPHFLGQVLSLMKEAMTASMTQAGVEETARLLEYAGCDKKLTDALALILIETLKGSAGPLAKITRRVAEFARRPHDLPQELRTAGHERLAKWVEACAQYRLYQKMMWTSVTVMRLVDAIGGIVTQLQESVKKNVLDSDLAWKLWAHEVRLRLTLWPPDAEGAAMALEIHERSMKNKPDEKLRHALDLFRSLSYESAAVLRGKKKLKDEVWNRLLEIRKKALEEFRGLAVAKLGADIEDVRGMAEGEGARHLLLVLKEVDDPAKRAEVKERADKALAALLFEKQIYLETMGASCEIHLPGVETLALSEINEAGLKSDPKRAQAIAENAKAQHADLVEPKGRSSSGRKRILDRILGMPTGGHPLEGCFGLEIVVDALRGFREVAATAPEEVARASAQHLLDLYLGLGSTQPDVLKEVNASKTERDMYRKIAEWAGGLPAVRESGVSPRFIPDLLRLIDGTPFETIVRERAGDATPEKSTEVLEAIREEGESLLQESVRLGIRDHVEIVTNIRSMHYKETSRASGKETKKCEDRAVLDLVGAKAREISTSLAKIVCSLDDAMFREFVEEGIRRCEAERKSEKNPDEVVKVCRRLRFLSEMKMFRDLVEAWKAKKVDEFPELMPSHFGVVCQDANPEALKIRKEMGEGKPMYHVVFQTSIPGLWGQFWMPESPFKPDGSVDLDVCDKYGIPVDKKNPGNLRVEVLRGRLDKEAKFTVNRPADLQEVAKGKWDFVGWVTKAWEICAANREIRHPIECLPEGVRKFLARTNKSPPPGPQVLEAHILEEVVSKDAISNFAGAGEFLRAILKPEVGKPHRLTPEEIEMIFREDPPTTDKFPSDPEWNGKTFPVAGRLFEIFADRFKYMSSDARSATAGKMGMDVASLGEALELIRKAKKVRLERHSRLFAPEQLRVRARPDPENPEALSFEAESMVQETVLKMANDAAGELETLRQSILSNLSGLGLPAGRPAGVKRSALPDFVKAVLEKFERKGGYVVLDHMNDMVRCRIEGEKIEHVTAIVRQFVTDCARLGIRVEETTILRDAYPRRHFIVRLKNGMTAEIQIGTTATTRFLESRTVEITDRVERLVPKIGKEFGGTGRGVDYHVAMYDILDNIKDPELRKRFQLNELATEHDVLLRMTADPATMPPDFDARWKELSRKAGVTIDDLAGHDGGKTLQNAASKFQ